MTNATPLLDVRRLNVAFRSGAGQMVQAVRDVSFQVEPESTVALVGVGQWQVCLRIGGDGAFAGAKCPGFRGGVAI